MESGSSGTTRLGKLSTLRAGLTGNTRRNCKDGIFIDVNLQCLIPDFGFRPSDTPQNRKMSGHLKQRPRLQREIPSSKKTFDEESGLVYSQTSCKAGPMTADWVWKTTGSTREHRDFRSSGPGCSSLKNMAIRGVLLHSFSLTSEGLKALTWSIGQTLWQRILARLGCSIF